VGACIPTWTGNSFGEGFAFHQFQDERAHSVGFFDAVDGADVRVIQRGEHSRLTLEARATFGFCRERRREDFDRHLAPKRFVVRAVDLAHPTHAEQCADRVGPEPRTNECAWWIEPS